MESSNLRHCQINEKLPRVVDQFEICVTMTWFDMVANGTALTFPCSTNANDCRSDNRGVMSANSPESLSTKECLEHVQKKLLDFFDSDKLQLFEIELRPYRSSGSI
jgi:hypothetical protein